MIRTVPECYTINDLADWTDSLSTLSPPAKLAVIGDPIAHSKSPQMHNPALRACGMNARYVRVQVPAGSVARALRLFAERGFAGVNITIPHKFEALDAVDFVEPLARRLGAVNTVAIRDGKLHGFNSDGPGFLRSVKEAFGVEARDLRVMILGAGGGAGRAVAVQCAMEGSRLILVNRTMEKIERLVTEIRPMAKHAIAFRWSDMSRVLPVADLIVNATSLGMKADDPPLLPPGGLLARHRVFDMVYRAGGQLTSLGEAAREAGAAYVDGSTLLLHQGALSFEYWFNIPAPIEAMRAGLRAALIS